KDLLSIQKEQIKRRPWADMGEIIVFRSIPKLMPALHKVLPFSHNEALAADEVVGLNENGHIDKISKLGSGGVYAVKQNHRRWLQYDKLLFPANPAASWLEIQWMPGSGLVS